MKPTLTRISRLIMAGLLCMAMCLQVNLFPAVFAEELPAEEPAVTGQEPESSLISPDPDIQTENPDDSKTEGTEEEDADQNQTPDGLPSEPDNPEQNDNQENDPGVQTDRFPDTVGHWSADIVTFWVDQDIVSGYPDGSFRPDDSISRAEAASLAADIKKISGEKEPVFSDVPEDHWAFNCIQACYTFGIMKGTGINLFRPEQKISRQEAMTMLYRTSDLAPASPEDNLQSIPDQEMLSEWAKEAAATLMKEGIVKGDEKGMILPLKAVTRAEFLTMLYRLETMELWDPTLQEKFALMNPKWIVHTLNPDGSNSTEITVKACNINEQTLILPSSIDVHNIKLECTLPDPDNTVVMVSGNKKMSSDTVLDLTELSSPDQENAYPLTVSISDGEIQRDYSYRVLLGNSLDTIFLSSAEQSGGRYYVEKTKGNSVDASMQMVSLDGNIIYDGDLKQLKSRGNSTFEYAKKPYQIKLKNETDLIGNGEQGKTWVLLANYADPTMIKDKMCKDLASDFQLPGTPDCKWIDLYFDGEYRGIYLLTEKIEISSIGLDITNLEEEFEEKNENYGKKPVAEISTNIYGNEIQYTKDLINPKNIKNGYLIELNNSQYDEINGFITSRGIGVNIKAPEYLSKQAVKYISEYYQEFEDAVYAVNQRGRYTGINSRTKRSFSEYCDLDSMARMYLLYQFSLNADAYFGSTYFYMEDNILHQGPVWDSDLSFGIVWDEVYKPDHELQNSYLAEALERLPAFRKAVKELYDKEFRELELQYTNEILNEYKEKLSVSESRNHLIWPEYYQIAAFEVAYYKGISYDEVISDLQQWMTERINYLDRKFEKWNR